MDSWKPKPTGNFHVKADKVAVPKMEDPRITKLKLIAKEKKTRKSKEEIRRKKD